MAGDSLAMAKDLHRSLTELARENSALASVLLDCALLVAEMKHDRERSRIVWESVLAELTRLRGVTKKPRAATTQLTLVTGGRK